MWDLMVAAWSMIYLPFVKKTIFMVDARKLLVPPIQVRIAVLMVRFDVRQLQLPRFAYPWDTVALRGAKHRATS